MENDLHMQADRQTDRHTDRQTGHCSAGIVLIWCLRLRRPFLINGHLFPCLASVPCPGTEEVRRTRVTDGCRNQWLLPSGGQQFIMVSTRLRFKTKQCM